MRTIDDIHDEWLVLRCQDGDAAAMEELVERWQPRLIRHALHLLGRAEAASDVVQTSWIAIIGGLHRLDDPACFRRWAYQILTHKSADWIRRQQRERQKIRQDKCRLLDQRAIDDDHSDRTVGLRQAIRELEPERRVILSMFYIDGMPLNEIAEALALPVGTVKSRLHYARLALKRLIEASET